jgi:hypothetical protein
MPEWWTYSPSDFVMFSPRTYYRLVELYNREVWPAHGVALGLGAALLWLPRHAGVWASRVIAAILAVAWLWVAWAFHLERFATINWAATYFALGFAIEGMMLLWLGAISGRLRFQLEHRRFGLVILVFALLVQPLTAPLAGRPWQQMEVFGLMPDPTAVATLGVLLLSRQRIVWLLWVVPLLWCAIAGATFLGSQG